MIVFFPCTLRLQQTLYQEAFGDTDSSTYPERLKQHAINMQSEGCLAKSALTTDNQLIFAIITPLMQRVLTLLPQASEMMFVDSTGNCDRNGVRIFLLLTHCAAGGLPVGCVLTQSESEATLTSAFGMYKDILPKDAFSKNGFPAVIMTDDCEAERNALQKAFPRSILLLCIFHVLQAGWRWLRMAKNAIPMWSRQDLYFCLKKMLYSKSEDDMVGHYADVADSCGYPTFVAYLKLKYDRRAEMGLCFRKSLMVRGNNTNNYCEAAMKVLKDCVLQRTKAYNILQLADFISTRL